ncbi:MAG: hypothetical protein QNJ72_10320 [Pleurocapsa sp. MO_226.B13]|nr:hypothetical protein [Pleurocapsa sp. MO_226.B13]
MWRKNRRIPDETPISQCELRSPRSPSLMSALGVCHKTDYLLLAENADSKLAKADKLGIEQLLR